MAIKCKNCGEEKDVKYFEFIQSKTCIRCKLDEEIQRYAELQIEKRDKNITALKALLADGIEACIFKNSRRLKRFSDEAMVSVGGKYARKCYEKY